MALTIEIKVVPQSGKSGWELNKNGKIVCFLKSAAEKGAANKELIKTVSKLLRVPQQEIEIIKGLLDRYKIIKIHTGIILEEFFKKVGIDGHQIKIF